MIQSAYLETVRDDLLARLENGDIFINDTLSVPVKAASIATHLIADIRDGVALEITAPLVTSIPVITNVKLRTKSGAIVAEKTGRIETSGAQFLSLSFVIEVKGGM